MTHWTPADLDRKWYLVPSGDGDLCHCNDNGKPACGQMGLFNQENTDAENHNSISAQL